MRRIVPRIVEEQGAVGAELEHGGDVHPLRGEEREAQAAGDEEPLRDFAEKVAIASSMNASFSGWLFR